MTFNKDYLKGANFVQDNMMMSRSEHWMPWPRTHGKGDALWRTSYAYIVYHEKMLFKGIMSCFKRVYQDDGTYIYQAERYPGYGSETVSRDQVAGALTALKYHGHDEEFNDISKNLRWKLSNKYNQTLDFYLWHKGVAGNRFLLELYFFVAILQMCIVVPWNWLMRLIGNFKSVPQKEYQGGVPSHELTWIRRAAARIMFPTYAYFIQCFQVHVTPGNSILKRILKWLMLMECESSNYVLQLILGGSVDIEQMKEYHSMRTYRWSARLDETTNRTLIKRTPEEMLYNDFDGDTLKWAIAKFLPNNI